MSRLGFIKSVLWSASIALVGAALFSARHHSSFPTTLMWLGLALIVAWSTKVPLLLKGIAVEFTPQGLTDYTNGLGFIAWSEIVSARESRFWFGEFVELEVKDPKIVLARLSWLRALMLRSNLRRGLPGFSINSGWVTGGAEAIFTGLRTMAPSIQT